MERKSYNPIRKDQVNFLETPADTNGACTLVQVDLADRVKWDCMIRRPLAEKFDCPEGELQVRLGKNTCCTRGNLLLPKPG